MKTVLGRWREWAERTRIAYTDRKKAWKLYDRALISPANRKDSLQWLYEQQEREARR